MLRVFSDRLIDSKDNEWFQNQLVINLKEGFKKEWNQVTGTTDTRLIFGDFMQESATGKSARTALEPSPSAHEPSRSHPSRTARNAT
eukprot:1495244-Prymnesium_polylepis.1